MIQATLVITVTVAREFLPGAILEDVVLGFDIKDSLGDGRSKRQTGKGGEEGNKGEELHLGGV